MKTTLFIPLVMSLPFAILAAYGELPLSESLEGQKKQMKERQAETQHLKQTEIENKENANYYENLDAMLEANSRCYQEKEEFDIRLCMLKANQKLAESGNFIAQDVVGRNYLEFHHNAEKALLWLKTAMENPQTPPVFKEKIAQDVEKLEEAIQSQIKEKGEVSKTIQEEMEKLKKDKEIAIKERRKAELLQNKEISDFFKEIEEFLDKSTPCYNKEDEHEIMVCSLQTLKKLAQKGNFIAEHQMGNIYENNYANKTMANRWYDKALMNPRTPKGYKLQIEKDRERLKAE